MSEQTGTVTIVISASGVTIQGVISREASGGVPPQNKALDAGNSGTLSTRTNDTDGELTLESGHDIETGDVICIGWTTSGVVSCARLATVGTVSGNTVPFSGATGDVLPTQGTSIVADEVVDLDADWDGDKATLFGAQFKDGAGIAIYEDSGNNVLKAFVAQAAQDVMLYWSNSTLTNPITGNAVDEVRIANLSAVANTYKQTGIYQSDT